MKILFISRAYGLHAGGMERLSYELIKSFTHELNTKVSTITYQAKPGQSLAWSRLNSALFSIYCIPRAIRQARQVDVVHIGDPVLSLAGYLIQKISKKPIAVTVHGLDVSFKNPIYRWYIHMFFRHFEQYIPISHYAAQKLQPWRVTGTVTIIPPGITDTYFTPTSDQHSVQPLAGENLADTKKKTVAGMDRFERLRRPVGHGAPPQRGETGRGTRRDFHAGKITPVSRNEHSGDGHKEVQLFTAGRLIKRKGHEWFIRNVLPGLPINFIYLIAGTGPEEEHIRQAAVEAAQTDRVHLLGRVSHTRLQELYNSVNIFVQPNIPQESDAEGFGIVLLEAALCERHVMASGIDGIPDAIHDGKNGYLLPAQDSAAWINKIQEVAALPPVNQNVRQYTLSHFSWNAITPQYQSIFTNMLKVSRN